MKLTERASVYEIRMTSDICHSSIEFCRGHAITQPQASPDLCTPLMLKQLLFCWY